MTEPLSWLPDGTPFSPRFNDRYHSDVNRGLDQAREVFFHGCGLPAAWADQPQWRILETGFGLGLNFLTTWKAWREDPHRPQILHFTSAEAWPVSAEDLRRAAPEPFKTLADELSQQFWGLLPGVHRLSFDEGRVLLTLYIGDAQAMLRQQSPVTDSVYLDGFSPKVNPELWNTHMIKAIARCCHHGTRLATWTIARAIRDDLAQCGFEVTKVPGVPPKRDNLQAVFNPRWEPRVTREALPDVSRPSAGACMVIGAGLAGSACAASLARRGWQVTVIDANHAAAGASGLPAGVFSPHVSPDDSVLSRLSRAGVRSTLQTLSLMERGTEWDDCGVLEHRVDGTPGIPRAWSEDAKHSGTDWSRTATPEQCTANGVPPDATTCWHLRAGWVRPPLLVAHQLAHPAIQQIDKAGVTQLVRELGDDGPRWCAINAQGDSIAVADLVIITAGFDSHALLQQRWPLQALRGQVSWGLHDDSTNDAPWPQVPVNGHGNLVPHVPMGGKGQGWVLGSTFERDVTELPPSAADRAMAHAENLGKLRELVPPLASAMEPSFSNSHATEVQGWSAVRCASHDRLPIVGPVDHAELPGLWVSTAMGSRGLTLSVLCAELLAARLHHEPLPVEARLAQLLSSERMVRR
ncbi:FAD-dependent 5-carboxymethylaminomethyl-2-thiouridine(34) oxidoreductase MnmC [Diaphorobacter sp. HDW4A]|uniref:FAD-dependent 5-carboxymethylaminomethyl-2-thiouridine(34) oxidoreductase MnmC n=1 Tax=Diaphorobacter sp. HDW4A TaxID=2714924 RepID=UPI001408C293|nr:FAD-dependent 5-carboxymethylaminomethyl-2-thiouridine(34) oxidoreductase MnmC [Diaphorobacter sp. HDW4A]QIL80456.1 FAD-dependent 5-carboxymethylaminomethyl-2-thiouridine(34) oxidoreductase MnmC [Diaphorobacter sp. HDW4A]